MIKGPYLTVKEKEKVAAVVTTFVACSLKSLLVVTVVQVGVPVTPATDAQAGAANDWSS